MDDLVDRKTIQQVKRDVEDDLLRRPGVTGVSIGMKRVGGSATDQLAIIVYVERKGSYAPVDEIADSIRGVPTDVVERRFITHQS